MNSIFLDLFNISIMASWLILVIIVVRLIFKRSPKWLICSLWGIVGIRLIFPFSIESTISLIPSKETIFTSVYQSRPYFNSGIDAIDNTVNNYIGNNYIEFVATSSNTFDTFLNILSIIWIFGIIVMLFYSLYSYYKINKKVQISINYKDNIYCCDDIDIPFILGIFHPKIHIPSGMNETQMNYVIQHELSHLERLDHYWKPLGFILLTIYWFNPIIWIAYNLFCKDVESACDERVIKDMNATSKIGYSETLLLCGINRNMLIASPLAFGEIGVKERVKEVLDYKKPKSWLIYLTLFITCIIMICFLTTPLSENKKIKNLEIASGSYKLPLELSNKQINEIIHVLNNYSIDEMKYTNEINVSKDYFKISYEKDDYKYNWFMYETCTKLLIFKDGKAHKIYSVKDSTLINEISKIITNLTFEEKNNINLLFNGYILLTDSNGNKVTDEFIQQNINKFKNNELDSLYKEMSKHSFIMILDNDGNPIQLNQNVGYNRFNSFEEEMKARLEDVYFYGSKMEFFDENGKRITLEIRNMKEEYMSNPDAVIQKVLNMVASIQE